MAWLLKEELPDVDMEKVIHMCLLHDLGEAVTGDIPAFEKKEQDRSVERKAVDGLLSMLPGKTGEEAKVLFTEMNALKTEEAKVYKALDKLEAVIAHNESDISWNMSCSRPMQRKASRAFRFWRKFRGWQ